VASTFYGLTLLVAAALLSLLWRYALHARLIRPDVKDEEITLLTQRLTPGLAGYGLFIVAGLFVPVVAVIGHLVIALFFLLPVPILRRQRRR
jgi:TMEM175 potassium channel family protein